MKAFAWFVVLCVMLVTLLSIPVSSSEFQTSYVGFVQNGGFVENAPSLVHLSNGTFLVAYESAANVNGRYSINMSWSTDGSSWSKSWTVVASGGAMGNRHPSLVQRDDGMLFMVYSSDRTGVLDYRLYAALSIDGRTWSEEELSVVGPAVNPFLIVDSGGGYAMSYQVYSPRPLMPVESGSYFTRSEDGFNWSDPVRVSGYSLPRLTREPSGGSYLMTFQGGGSGDFEIRSSLSHDGVEWSSPTPITSSGNNHDSFPMNLRNGSYAIFYASAVDGAYDLFWMWSADMLVWSDPVSLGLWNENFDTQPRALELEDGRYIVVWGYESVPSYVDVDIAVAWLEYHETVDETGLRPVSLLPSSNITEDMVELVWTKFEDSASFYDYEIYFSTNSDPLSDFARGLIRDINVTYFFVGGLLPGTDYYALVRTYTVGGEYTDSNILKVTTLGDLLEEGEDITNPEADLEDESFEDEDAADDELAEDDSTSLSGFHLAFLGVAALFATFGRLRFGRRRILR